MIHFVDQNAQSPVVDRLAVSFIEQDLGGNIFWRATQGIGPIDDNLGEAKVSKLQIAIHADKQVLRLQVSIDDVHSVHVIEDMGHLSGIKPISN